MNSKKNNNIEKFTASTKSTLEWWHIVLIIIFICMFFLPSIFIYNANDGTITKNPALWGEPKSK